MTRPHLREDERKIEAQVVDVAEHYGGGLVTVALLLLDRLDEARAEIAAVRAAERKSPP